MTRAICDDAGIHCRRAIRVVDVLAVMLCITTVAAPFAPRLPEK